MKKILCVAALLFALGAAFVSLQAQEKPGASIARYEYAVVKWDGPDRLFYNLPNKFEMVHLEKTGVVIPKEAQEEEFCLSVAANIMAKDGWEPINLDSRRILFRRPVK